MQNYKNASEKLCVPVSGRVSCSFSCTYLLLQIVLTKANSTSVPMMNVVQTMNHTSLAIMYETLGNALPVWQDKVMKVKIVLMPGKKVLTCIDSVDG